MPITPSHFPPIAAPTSGEIMAGTPYQPGTDSRRLVQIDPSFPFVLLWHPTQHEVDTSTGTPVLVPRLRTLRADPGVCGVDGRGGMALALADAEQDGWRRLDPLTSCPPAYTPDGAAGYVRVYQTRRGPAHLTAFEAVKNSPVGHVVTRDNARWVAWCQYLYESGQVWRPDEDYAAALLERLQQRANARLMKTSSEDERKRTAEAAREQSAAAEAALAGLRAPKAGASAKGGAA